MTLCLQIDVGNTRGKWRLMQADTCLQRGHFTREEHASLQTLAETHRPSQIWLASVADEHYQARLLDTLQGLFGVVPWAPKTPASSGGLRNSYAQPCRMGVDRWLAMLAAFTLTQGAVCVVDAGSALTIDLVAANGMHLGGYIIPGAQLMESALLRDTDRVRFDEDIGYELSPGQSTAEAVRHGIALGQVGAVAKALDQQSAAPSLVFTGGGGETLRSLLGLGGDLRPDLVFEGLAELATLDAESSSGV